VGVYGQATGTAGTRIGIFGFASGGTTNWAGFFSSGNVFVTNDLRIGTGATDGATGYKVAVDGKIIAEELRIQNSTAWPDYVFSEDYMLPDLNDLEALIKEHGHLPNMPSAEVVDADGFDVGDIQIRTLQKVEELTLYLIDLQKQVNLLKDENAELKSLLQK
jgi:hypothetical protein